MTTLSQGAGATLGYANDDEGQVDVAALFAEPLAVPPAPTFPVTPNPVDYERADTHARLILSQAQELLLKLVADAAYHGNEIDGEALARTIKASFSDLASDLSGAFERQAESLPEPV